MSRIPSCALRALGLLLLIAAGSLSAQAPHHDWRTVETANFRLHYPRELEAWALRAAGRLEEVRSAVAAEVGFALNEKIDVVVADPISEANGSAWPFAGAGRIVLWTTPPGAEGALAAPGDWLDILNVHEQAHILHLMRPSRNEWQRRLWSLSPVTPFPISFAPRWVSEGYATMIEGRLAGGRPQGDFRPLVLRRWAQLGRLPSYSQLNSDRQNFLGMSMAYLIGSAYLEWLEASHGEGSLRNLWARMTARERRSFDQAFRGVFGDSPESLYRRFSAEITHQALELERVTAEAGQQGELWQDLSWATEAPEVSSDGKWLVTVLRKRGSPSTVAVYSTAPDEQGERKERERIDRMLARDPEDVAPVRRRPLPRRPAHELRMPDRIEPRHPQWIGSGAVLFSRAEVTSEGLRKPDLFQWDLRTGNVRRITRNAGVREAAPVPGSDVAIAVRHELGFSELVQVNLSSGEVTPFRPRSLDVTYAHPAVSPDGARVIWVENRGGDWSLVAASMSDGEPFWRHDVSDGVVSAPAWEGENVVATVGRLGFYELWRFPTTDGSAPEQLTVSEGGAFSPAVAPTGEIYFLSLDADGIDIRVLGTPTAVAGVVLPPGLAPVTRETPSSTRTYATAEVAPGRKYRGRAETVVLAGLSYGPSTSGGELIVRSGDILGRWSSLLMAGSHSDQAPSGIAMAGVWRGWPVAVGAHVFSTDAGSATGAPAKGIALDTEWVRHFSAGRLSVAAGAMAGRHDRMSASDEVSAAVDASIVGRQEAAHFALSTSFRTLVGTRSVDHDSTGYFIGSTSLGIERGASSARVIAAGGWLHESSPRDELLFRLGGLRTSLLPDIALHQQIDQPALDFATAAGDRFLRGRTEVTLPGVPLTGFYDSFRFSLDGETVKLALAGAELSYRLPAEPILRLPGASIQFGGARVVEGELRGKSEIWLNLRWRR